MMTGLITLVLIATADKAKTRSPQRTQSSQKQALFYQSAMYPGFPL